MFLYQKVLNYNEMKKLISLLIILSIISVAYGDGCVYYYYTHKKDFFHPLTENLQVAVINYNNGMEDMLISIKTKPKGDGAFWIFPIPAKPEESEIDIIQKFPRISGYEPKSKLGAEIKNSQDLMIYSQIYSLSLVGVFPLGVGGATYTSSEMDRGVSVHQIIEKAGITTQLITCRDGNGLSNYLSEKGLSIPDDLMPIIGDYIGEDYSFVVSWISNPEEYKAGLKQGDIALRIRFSTDRIYYPLKLTSIYGDRLIPIYLYIIGRVRPELYDSIRESTKTDYFISEEFQVPSELSSFFGREGQVSNLKYTKVKIYTRARNLEEDLWFDNYTPIDVLIADLFSPFSPLMSILLFALFSCLASILAGFAIFRGKVPIKDLITMGLFNFLTLFGVSIAAIKKIKIYETEEQERSKTKRDILIYILTIYSPLILVLISLSMFFFPPIIFPFLLVIFGVPYTIIFALPFSMIIISLMRNRKPKTISRVLGYIMLFSVLFLIISLSGTSLMHMIYKPEIIVWGKGQTGFEKIKVIDHSHTSGQSFDVVFMNGAGVTVNGTCVIDRAESTPQSFGFIAPGDKFTVTLTSGGVECPSGGAYYDFYINVTWTDNVTGIEHTESGRIWGGC